MVFIISQAVFILINIGNAVVDSRKIKSGYHIDHFLNGLFYAAMVALNVIFYTVMFKFDLLYITVFSVACACNRQLFFDIPLNLMRKLKWDYVSPDPESKIDQIEKKLFGNNGRTPNYIYGSVFIVTILVNIIFDL